MQVVVKTTKSCHNIQCQQLNGGTKTVSSTFDIHLEWHKITIPLPRKKISKILIDQIDIGMILNSGYEHNGNYTIWIHGDIGTLKVRVHDCIEQDDLLKFNNLKLKYLCTVSSATSTPDFLPTHIRRFFEQSEGPYWWNYKYKDKLPYRTTEIELNKEQLLASLDDDLKFTDQKFYANANCKSLQRRPELPLTNVSDIKNKTLRSFLQAVGYTKVLQIQYVEMPAKSFIDIHRDDFANVSGLEYVKGPSQLYCVLKGNENNFKMKFNHAGVIDLSKPTFINNNNFIHSLYYDGNEPRGALLIYGDA